MRKEYQVDLTDRMAYATVLAVERKEGIAKGSIEKRKAIAVKMINKKLTDQMILDFTELTSGELAELKASLKRGDK